MARPVTLLICGLAVLFGAQVSSGANDIFSTIAAQTDLFLLQNALTLGNLQQYFSNSTLNLTFFAPSDTAFMNALAELGLTQTDLAANAVKMAPVLQYHVLTAMYTTTTLPNNTLLPTALTAGNTPVPLGTLKVGSNITLLGVGSDATLNRTNIGAGTSTIHVINQVLYPFFTNLWKAIVRTPTTSTGSGSFRALVSQAGSEVISLFSDVTVEYTVFAPIQSAFTASSLGLLTSLDASTARKYVYYHTIRGVVTDADFTTAGTTVVTLTGQTVILKLDATGNKTIISPTSTATLITRNPYTAGFRSDGTFRSGLYVIDRVLVPPPIGTVSAALAWFANVGITQQAIANSIAFNVTFTTSLFGGTFLAPTDAAWNALLAAKGVTKDQLLAQPATLVQVLAGHYIPTTVVTIPSATNASYAAFGAISTVTTKKYGTSNVTVTVGSITANVVSQDIRTDFETASVLVIDQVLVPSNVTIKANPNAGSRAAPSLYLLVCSTVAVLMLSLFGMY